MSQTARVFCLDAGSRVVDTRAVEFTSNDDLARQLEPDLRRYAAIEAWQANVCLLRLRGERAPDARRDEGR